MKFLQTRSWLQQYKIVFIFYLYNSILWYVVQFYARMEIGSTSHFLFSSACIYVQDQLHFEQLNRGEYAQFPKVLTISQIKLILCKFSLTLKDGGRGVIHPPLRSCHFSSNDQNVIKLPDFFKNDEKSYFEHTLKDRLDNGPS